MTLPNFGPTHLLAGNLEGEVSLAALGQFVYLVGFSLAFFWDGYTGPTITVPAVVTLFLVMQLTARVRWAEVIGRKPVAKVSEA